VKSLKSFVLTSIIVISCSPAFADNSLFLNKDSRFHPVVSDRGMVVSQEAIASRVGADILAAGGNAIDAAVATGFALAVTLPRAGNIGGGGFMLVYLAEQKKTIAIDYREMAPTTAHRDMFVNKQGDVDNAKARYSAQSSGIPGTVAGLLHALKKYGRLSLSEVIQPAVKLATQGFEVNHDLSDSLRSSAERLQQQSASKRYFYKKNGDFYLPGDRLVQNDLGATLSRIIERGEVGFYQGRTAELIIAQMQRSGGLITGEDLTNYLVVERTPVCGTYRSASLCAMPPPSSGGVHLLQMLNILEGWDIAKLEHNSAAYMHLLIEAMRSAYADRSLYLGDPDFTPVPVKQLIDKQYAATLRAQIDTQKARLSSEVPPGLDDFLAQQSPESDETTHFSVWDKWGNIVSNTYTLNFAYGNGIAVEGAGFLLNNEMDDFSSKPGTANAYGLIGGVANAIAPHKRPLSSMTPSIVFDATGDPIMATGSPGGSTIITIVLQMILNRVDFAMGIAEATAAPRIHHQWLPDMVYYEKGISSDSLHILQQMGHGVHSAPRVLGATQSIAIQRGRLAGSADLRRQGAGAVPQPNSP